MQFKDVLKLDEDVPHIREAAKVSLGELSKDMAQLRAGLKDVAREIEFHRGQSPLANDKFVPVMREFQATATCRLAEIEDQFQDMKVNFSYLNIKLFWNCYLYKDYLNWYIIVSEVDCIDIFLNFRHALNVPSVYLVKIRLLCNQTNFLEFLIHF